MTPTSIFFSSLKLPKCLDSNAFLIIQHPHDGKIISSALFLNYTPKMFKIKKKKLWRSTLRFHLGLEFQKTGIIN